MLEPVAALLQENEIEAAPQLCWLIKKGLIFFDETGTTTQMTRLRGRALKGSRRNS